MDAARFWRNTSQRLSPFWGRVLPFMVRERRGGASRCRATQGSFVRVRLKVSLFSCFLTPFSLASSHILASLSLSSSNLPLPLSQFSSNLLLPSAIYLLLSTLFYLPSSRYLLSYLLLSYMLSIIYLSSTIFFYLLSSSINLPSILYLSLPLTQRFSQCP